MRYLLLIGLYIFIQSGTGFASEPGTIAATICNEAGVCYAADPATMVIIIGLAQLADELSKKEPFGPNNDLVKNIKNMISDITRGPGPNNDIVRALNNISSDLRCGP